MMKTLRPRVKVYFISLLFLTLLFSIICIPLYLNGTLTPSHIISIIASALIAHLIASLPFPPNLLSLPKRKPKPSVSTDSSTASTLYVGNLQYRTKREDLVVIFSKFGEVLGARIILDKDSRKSKGYGFVEMSSRDAVSAVAALNGSDFNGRSLRVNEAKGR